MPVNKILLVDGYNVINRIHELKAALDGGLENARKRLANLISNWNHNHPAYECIIIFDGDHKFAGNRKHRIAGIRCIFSRFRHGGDTELIRSVREYRGKQSDITVVSDDNNVRNNCKAHGAIVQPSAYIMTDKSPRSQAKQGSSADGKGIDSKTDSEINRELRKKYGL